MNEFEADIAAIQRMQAVPRILDVVCKTTGMGFSAVARVTEDRWICCASRDDIAFGLARGGELQVKTTICHEIRQSQTIEMFKLFADLIAAHLELSDRFSVSLSNLRDERFNSVLRERFVAVLGHDLRNPLAAIAAGARLFPKAKSEKELVNISTMMQAASIACLGSSRMYSTWREPVWARASLLH